MTDDPRTLRHVRPCDEGSALCFTALLHVEECTALRPLLVDLAVFADRQHDFKSGDCHPQPGVDCWPFCDACKVLARVPTDVLDEARRVRAERES